MNDRRIIHGCRTGPAGQIGDHKEGSPSRHIGSHGSTRRAVDGSNLQMGGHKAYGQGGTSTTPAILRSSPTDRLGTLLPEKWTCIRPSRRSRPHLKSNPPGVPGTAWPPAAPAHTGGKMDPLRIPSSVSRSGAEYPHLVHRMGTVIRFLRNKQYAGAISSQKAGQVFLHTAPTKEKLVPFSR